MTSPLDCYLLYPRAVWRELWLAFREFPSRRRNRAWLLLCLRPGEKGEGDDDPFSPSERELAEARIARFLSYRTQRFPLARHASNPEVYSVRLPFCRILVDVTPTTSFVEASWQQYVLLWDSVPAVTCHPRCTTTRSTNFKSVIVHVMPPPALARNYDDGDAGYDSLRDRLTVRTQFTRDAFSSRWRNIASREEGLLAVLGPAATP